MLILIKNEKEKLISFMNVLFITMINHKFKNWKVYNNTTNRRASFVGIRLKNFLL